MLTREEITARELRESIESNQALRFAMANGNFLVVAKYVNRQGDTRYSLSRYNEGEREGIDTPISAEYFDFAGEALRALEWYPIEKVETATLPKKAIRKAGKIIGYQF